MKTKLFEQLKSKCKDCGLTKKALEELTDIGVAGLKDDSTDEDIAAKADELVKFAKLTQGEITRKTKKQQSAKPSGKSSEDEDGEGDGEGDNSSDALMKKVLARLDALETENKSLKEERAASERASAIAEKAKKLGIPEFVAKRLTFAEDADIDAELTSLKQEFVSASLMPKGQAHEVGFDKDAAVADAKAWAAGLPD